MASPGFWKLVAGGTLVVASLGVFLATSRPETPADLARRAAARESNSGLELEGGPSRLPAKSARVREAATDRVAAWLGDPEISPEQAADRLWTVAADRREPEPVREEALAHALNLSEDARFMAEVVPALSVEGLWPGSLGLALLDDIYDRPATVQLAAAIAMLPVAAPELRAEIRELVEFLVDGEAASDLDDRSLLEAARSRLSGGSAGQGK